MYAGPATRGRRRSKPLFATAAVLAVALLVGGYFLRVATEPSGIPADMDATRTYGIGNDGYIKQFTWDEYSSRKGFCLSTDLVEGRRLTESQRIDCSEPHLVETFASNTFYAKPDETDNWTDIEYPGFDHLAGFAESFCSAVFRSDQVTDTSSLRYMALVPSSDAWRERRNVYCFLYDRDHDQLERSFVAEVGE